MTRPLFMLAATLATAASAEPRRATLAVLPIVAEGAETHVDTLVEWEASAALAASGRYAVYHPKQVRELMVGEGLDPKAALTASEAQRLVDGLGVERGVWARLTHAGAGYRLSGAVYGAAGGARPFSVMLPDGSAASIERGAEELAAAVDALWQQHLPPPAVPAVYRSNLVDPKGWARCLERLNALPTSLDHPGVVSAGTLDDLVASCRLAAQRNPAHPATASALALALATAGDDVGAARLVEQLRQEGEALPLWWLARFWLSARYGAGDDGLAVLDAAVKQHPEQLLFAALRAELLEAQGRPTAALEAARAYQALAPGASTPLSLTARALAAVGRHAEATARARE
ncbi:MAG: hypothetical protein JNK82_32035, partial [Myxococcaceae bacterium]|nr:hypothetical protein [Myxococcaceae bacterium]